MLAFKTNQVDIHTIGWLGEESVVWVEDFFGEDIKPLSYNPLTLHETKLINLFDAKVWSHMSIPHY